MNQRRLTALACLLPLFALGCERDLSGLELAPLITDPVVWYDSFENGVDFQAFLGSRLDAVGVDPTDRQSGTASLLVSIPASEFAGGAFPTSPARNLSGYNALTFWAKASQTVSMDIVGLGNDNSGTSKYQASWSGIPLTTTWTKFTVPVPLPSRLAVEKGLFFFAEGPKFPTGHRIWLDDVRFELVSSITNPRPAMTSKLVNAFTGTNVNIDETRTTFAVDGTDQTIDHFPGYFDFASSDTTVAVVEGEVIRAIGPGTSEITAKLGSVDVQGKVTLRTIETPATPAPSPTLPASDVISLFSNVYPNRVVDTWSATWDRADVSDLKIDGNDVKGYTNLTFAGIEFITEPIDASQMTHLHIDVWIKDSSVFKVKLVQFTENKTLEAEQELVFSASSVPPFRPGSWASLDIPLSSYTGIPTKTRLSQLIISGGTTAFLDNVYFHK